MRLTSVLGMKVGFIGAGKMATALCRGFIQAGIITRVVKNMGTP